MTRPEPAPRADRADEWHHQSPWMMVLRPIKQLPQLIPVAIAVFVAGSAAPLMTLGATMLALVVLSVLPWLTTEYQVTDEHVRLRTGLLNRKVATARRDRIRSVDLTAPALHRVLGLEKVVVGTGSDEGKVELDCVPAPYARALHDYLMPTGSPASTDPTTTVAVADPPQVLARFRTDWLRFAPFSLGGFAAAAAIVGFAVQFAMQANLLDRFERTGTAALSRLADAPLGLVAGIAAAAVLVSGAVLSVGGYVLNYWGFTLARHPDATLRVSRGLLTTSATSLDEVRVRGVHLHEPVLMRPLGGARLSAIATGSSKSPLLLPPAPRDEAAAVAGAVASGADELSVPLVGHGRPARRRRFTRAALAGLVLAVVPLAAGVAGWIGPAASIALAGVAVVAMTAVATVRYRHLGTRVTDRLLIIGPPRIARHRFLVERDGIVGWQLRATPFQRRQRVATLILATAAGAEAYPMVDLADDAAAAVMVESTPEFVRPFLAAD
ncbi:MAG: PH domain-containing protein [Gordonia sp. (in: high G+C Gram-positive bacteria)]